MKKSRRDFIKKVSAGTAGITLGGMGLSARSYARIKGSNDRVNIGFWAVEHVAEDIETW